MAMTSGEMFFPRLTAFSIEAAHIADRVPRLRASSSGVISCRGSIRAWRKLVVSSMKLIRARETPWTRMRMRPSGSLSIRIMIATVPMSKTSPAPGFLLLESRWATSMIIRFSASA